MIKEVVVFDRINFNALSSEKVQFLRFFREAYAACWFDEFINEIIYIKR